MDVAPGEIVDMDENGAVKFPGERLKEVVTNVELLLEQEEDRVGRLLEAASTRCGPSLARTRT